MSSVQERLQMKRVPLDTWNTREQLCLASAVLRSGDQNWMSVSRALKSLGDPNRPADWYSQKSCAAQYGSLLEHVETPKRKKRTSEGVVETPQESILKRLTQERIIEIQKTMSELSQQYQHLKEELNEVKSPHTSEMRLKEMITAIDIERHQREREQVKYQQWLREREEKRLRIERAWKPTPPNTPTTHSVAVVSGSPSSSPLLTSLLKSAASSIPQTTPSLLNLHPSTIVDTTSPSAGAPTLSKLLEKPSTGPLRTTSTPQTIVTTPPDNNKHAVIEQIKNQLQEIENQLKVSSPVSLLPPTTPVTTTTCIQTPQITLETPHSTMNTDVVTSSTTTPSIDKVDIDDIEIKAEDVYAFSDIDIEIPPVSSMHKNSTPRVIEKTVKKKESNACTPEPPFVETENFIEIKAPSPPVSIQVDMETTTETFQDAQQKNDVGDNTCNKIEANDVQQVISEESLPKESEPDELAKPLEDETQILVDNEKLVEEQNEKEAITSVEDDNSVQDSEEVHVEQDTVIEEKDDGESSADNKNEQDSTVTQTNVVEEDINEQQSIIANVKLETEEAELPRPNDESEMKVETEVKTETADEATETDDDTPMEVIREEEKQGRKRRDYSRRKTDFSDDDSTRLRPRGSGSECSGPGSPPTTPPTEPDRDYRLWKKSIMLVYSRLSAHKYASLFQRPISDDHAPGYSLAIKKPMDLTTIKKNIDAGTIRTTSEFQRDVLLMLSNAIMYNSSTHRVHQMAQEMHREAASQFGMLLQAQAHATLNDSPQPRAHKRKAQQSLQPQVFNKKRKLIENM